MSAIGIETWLPEIGGLGGHGGHIDANQNGPSLPETEDQHMSLPYSLNYLGAGKDSTGNTCAVVEVIRDGVGSIKTVIPFAGALNANPAKPIVDALAKLRHPVLTPARKAELLKECQALLDLGSQTDKQAIVADQPGWLPNFQYLTPVGQLHGKSTLPVGMAVSDIAAVHRWIPVGNLSAWKKTALKLATGSPSLVFACASALAGPLLELRKLEGVVFSFLGKSSTGKSVSLRFASSVVGGDPHRKTGFAASWSSTEAGVEVLSREGRDSMVLLDDTLLVAARGKKKGEVLADMIFSLVSGIEKRRKSTPTSASAHRLIAWSSSNTALRRLVEESGQDYGEMFDVRHIEIPVSWQQGMFERIPDGITPRDFVELLKKATVSNYGVAFERFIGRLTTWRQVKSKQLEKFIEAREAEALRALGITGEEQVDGRVADYFVLVYVAGCLAKKFGALPWGRKTLLNAVLDCWGRYQQHQEGLAVESPINLLQRYIAEYRDRFLLAGTKEIPKTQSARNQCPGFYNSDANGMVREFMLLKPTFVRVIGGEDRLNWALGTLSQSGLLISDKGKNFPKRKLAKGWRQRTVCIRPGILRA